MTMKKPFSRVWNSFFILNEVLLVLSAIGWVWGIEHAQQVFWTTLIIEMIVGLKVILDTMNKE
jgi:hypothetical protein